ncbi:hypothetical protein NC651_016576 [Populus alba x Populus x berolinensis]|nr:hypothetical protein NC651_016576 [Populus alba x Populus x berolinensis]
MSSQYDISPAFDSLSSPAFLPSLILLYLLVTMQGKGRSKGHVWLLLSLNLGFAHFKFWVLWTRGFLWCLELVLAVGEKGLS